MAGRGQQPGALDLSLAGWLPSCKECCCRTTWRSEEQICALVNWSRWSDISRAEILCCGYGCWDWQLPQLRKEEWLYHTQGKYGGTHHQLQRCNSLPQDSCLGFWLTYTAKPYSLMISTPHREAKPVVGSTLRTEGWPDRECSLRHNQRRPERMESWCLSSSKQAAVKDDKY